MKLYQQIAVTLDARQNCLESGNTEWADRHEETLEALEKLLPSGSGFDSPARIEGSGQRIEITGSYHVMNENGMYTHWIDFKVSVHASLMFGFELTVSGRFGKDQDLKDFIGEEYRYILNAEITGKCVGDTIHWKLL